MSVIDSFAPLAAALAATCRCWRCSGWPSSSADTLRTGEVALIERIARVGKPDPVARPLPLHATCSRPLWRPTISIIAAIARRRWPGSGIAQRRASASRRSASRYSSSPSIHVRQVASCSRASGFPGLVQQVREHRRSLATAPRTRRPARSIAAHAGPSTTRPWPPLAAHGSDSTRRVDGARTWTWRQVHAASLALAARSRPRSGGVQPVRLALGFLVTFARRAAQPLPDRPPPSASSADLAGGAPARRPRPRQRWSTTPALPPALSAMAAAPRRRSSAAPPVPAGDRRPTCAGLERRRGTPSPCCLLHLRQHRRAAAAVKTLGQLRRGAPRAGRAAGIRRRRRAGGLARDRLQRAAAAHVRPRDLGAAAAGARLAGAGPPAAAAG